MVKIANEKAKPGLLLLSALCSVTQSNFFRKEKLLPLVSYGQASPLIYHCKQSVNPKALTQHAGVLLMCLRYGSVRF